APGHERLARRLADRGADVVVDEAVAPGGEGVEVRRRAGLVAHPPRRVRVHVVGGDDHEVEWFRAAGAQRRRGDEQGREGEAAGKASGPWHGWPSGSGTADGSSGPSTFAVAALPVKGLPVAARVEAVRAPRRRGPEPPPTGPRRARLV